MDLNALSSDQRYQLQRLNDRLAAIEHHIQREATILNTQLQARVQDPADWLSDYEIELEVTFWLREDDPAYQEDDDNILATLRERLKGCAQHDFGIDDRINHNAFQQMDGHPMQGEVHCWLYHRLYGHTDLWFDDMLRIGRIWVDIQVWYQHTCEV
jgi:hypothetical protein